MVQGTTEKLPIRCSASKVHSLGHIISESWGGDKVESDSDIIFGELLSCHLIPLCPFNGRSGLLDTHFYREARDTSAGCSVLVLDKASATL